MKVSHGLENASKGGSVTATTGAFLHVTNNQGRLSKRAYADEDDRIKIDSATQLYCGTVKRIPISDDPKTAARLLAQGLNKLRPEDAIILGDLVQPEDVADIVTTKELSKRRAKRSKSSRPAIARKRKHITYRPKRPAWLLVDVDAKGLPKGMAPKAAWPALCKAAPGINNTARVTRPSASSGIANTNTGEKFKGGGLHIFLLVKDGADIDRATIALDKRLWLAGCGNIVFSADGKMLLRSPVDTAVRFPERLVYEGAVECVSPIMVDPDARVAVAAGDVVLDTLKVIPELSEKEEIECQRLVTEAKQAAQGESETRHEDYISRRAAELVKTQGVSIKEARQVVVSRAGGLLRADDILIFAKYGAVPVAEVLASPDKYDGEACADPVEGTEYGTTTAKFFANKDSGNPLVNSNAHGGDRIFHFRDPAEAFDVVGGEDGQIQDWVAEDNKKACHTAYGSQDVVICFDDSEQGYAVMRVSNFKSLHKNRRSVVVGKKSVCRADAWLDHKDRAVAENGITVRFGQPPGLTDDGFFNACSGLIEAIKGNWSKLRDHILKVICGGDPIKFEYTLNWISWGYQNPGKPIGVCLVFQGGQGTGKGMLIRAIRSVYGKHGVYMSNSKHLVGHFNSQLRSAAFVEADEAIFPGDRGQAAKLKSLITEPTIMIEEKGLPAVNSSNMLKIVMATNETRAVNIGHDDRRFVVFEVSEKRKGDYEYFTQIYAEIEAGGPAAMLHDLLQRDLSKFNPERDRPATEAHATQKRLSLPYLEAWWAERLEEGNLPHHDGFGCILDSLTRHGESDFDAWSRGPVEASTQRLTKSANEWIKERYPQAHKRSNAYDVHKMLGPYLDPSSPAHGRNKRGSLNGERVRYLTLRSLDDCCGIGRERLGLDMGGAQTACGGDEPEIDPFS